MTDLMKRQKSENGMQDKNIKERENTPDKYKWNIEKMFPDESVIDTVLDESVKEAEKFKDLRGTITESAESLLSALESKDKLWQKIEDIYVYARMRRDEDNRKSKYQAMTDKCMSVIAAVSASLSFFTPELISVPKEKIDGFLKENEKLRIYEHYLDEVFREKEHVLSEKEENILAMMSEVTGATNDIFTMFNNADVKFGKIKDEDGEDVELTHGNYIKFMQSKDRNVRKEAFQHMYRPYQDFINTIAATYNYNTKNDVVSARLRNYGSSRAAALSGDNVPGAVYDNLISVVNDNLPVMHRYMKLRKKLMGLDELHMYDIYVKLTDMKEKKIPYEEGLDIIRKALHILGDEYVARMNDGFRSGWVDVYENAGKTSGAYSFGSYSSMPYMLLNYTDTLQDVFTVIHEMGHSMHSSYTRENQPYVYGGHSIFTAEVASTVNESLLMNYLIDNAENKEMLKYLLNMYIEEFRTTLFRQTMFAEFEDITHKAIESGHVLTAEWMCSEYKKLNEKYYGDDVVSDEEISYEWARIPHFYNAFYVYKYATGYSAATAISGKIRNEGEKAASDYLEFLKTGESDYPIELLKIAGVDMSTSEPVENAMKVFRELVEKFEGLVQ